MVHHRTAYPHKPIVLATLSFLIGAWLAFPATSLAVERFETPVGFKVNETGAATFSIPIKVPPGTAGMEPNISLNYSSQGGDGLLGVGWSLGGLSAIYRCGRTLIQDGAKVTVNYNAGDRFCMDGQRLVAVTGEYGANGTEYRTERESFTKVISYGIAGNGPAWFKAWTKGGQIMEFGNTANSAIQARDTSKIIRVWAVNKISDTTGNTISVNYVEENSELNYDFRPSSIAYTSNVNAATPSSNIVRFVYEARPDVAPLYQGGFLIKNSMRLTHVETYTDTNGTAVDGLTRVKEYRLKYILSPATGRSRLTSIQECDGPVTSATSTCLPATTLKWQSSKNPFAAAGSFNLKTSLLAHSNKTQGHSLGDFNGDGRTDILKFADDYSQNKLYLSSGDGSFTESASFNLKSYYLAHSNKTQGHSLGDFNGDGRTDILKFSDDYSLNKLYLSNGDGSFAESASFNLKSYWLAHSNKTQGHSLGDFNGDGRTDILKFADDYSLNKLYLSNGDGSFAESASFNLNLISSPLAHSTKTLGHSLGDFNGDGKTDILKYQVTTLPQDINKLYLSNGNGAFTEATGFSLKSTSLAVHSTKLYGHSLGDFNGDGKTDVLAYAADPLENKLYLSRGNGSFELTDSSIPGIANNLGTLGHSLGDFNGDGKSDILRYSDTPANNLLLLSGGDGTFDTYSGLALGSAILARSTKTHGHSLSDFNGDGKADILRYANDFAQNQLFSERESLVNDLLQTLTTGLGTTTSLRYKPLSDNTVYTKYTGALYPYLDIQAALYVVATSTVPDGIGGVRSTDYAYAGARSHLQGGGFMGFRQLNVTDRATGFKTATVFRQDYPYQGLPTSFTQTQANSNLLKSITNSWQFTSYADTALPIATTAGSKHHYPALTAMVEKTFDLSGALVTEVGTTTQYDAYGNATEVNSITNDGYRKTIINTYAPPNLSKWFIAQMIRSEVTATSPDTLPAPPPVIAPAPAVPPTTHIAAFDAVKNEGSDGATAFTFLVSRDGDTTFGSSISWAVSGRGTQAATTADFFGGSLPAGILNFDAGQVFQIFTIYVQGDSTAEMDEGYTVSLSNPTNAVLGIATAAGAIHNDDLEAFIFTRSITALTRAYNLRSDAIAAGWDQISPLVATITINSGVYLYAATATGYAFEVSGAYPDGSSISLINNGFIFGTSATAGNALYTQHSMAITNNGQISAGTATYSVGNALITWLTRGVVSGAQLNVALPASVNIVALAANQVEGNSGTTPFKFIVSRSSMIPDTARVTWTVAGIGANPANAADFAGGLLPSGTLNFVGGQASQELIINVQGDAVFEKKEDFTVVLSNPIGATLGINKVAGTILNDDTGPSITAPSANSVFNTPANITILAAAYSDGTTSKIEFYDNGILLGSSTAAPYSYLWENAPAGAHQLTVQATDYLGTVTTSTPVAITVNTSPQVSLTAPESNAVYIASASSPAVITLSADAADADGNISKVEFYTRSATNLAGITSKPVLPPSPTLLGTATTPPYSYVWSNAPAGAHQISAYATDNQGATAVSASVAINVVNNIDLVMTAVSTTATNVHVGASFAITNTEKNQGMTGTTVSGNTVKLYLSTDTTITDTDIALTNGTRAVAALAAGTISTAITTVTVPVTVASGTYYIGAIADATGLQNESNETNNSRASVATILVINNVDLVMTTLSTTAIDVHVGASFAISNTEKNQGTTNATVSNTVKIYLSTDATITDADIALTNGTRTVAALAAGAISTATTTVTVPVTVEPGTYYIGAIADADNTQPETNETNNALASATAITVLRNVDLVMTTVSTTATNVPVGASFAITNIETNRGTTKMTAANNTIMFYLSTDATITNTDIALTGTQEVAALAAGASSTATTTVTVPVTVRPGAYYIGAIADATGLQIETSEANNGRRGGAIAVVRNVDLVMTTVSTTATSVPVGASFAITNIEKNQGTTKMTAASNTIMFYLSTDATITNTDIALTGTQEVAALAAGASSTATTTVTVPVTVTPGVYFFGAIADATGLQIETVETNNAINALGKTIVVNATPTVNLTAPANNAAYTRLATTATLPTVAVGFYPSDIAVNPSTNKIYVMNHNSGSVTVINGATHTPSTVAVDFYLSSIAVNSTNNKIYVARDGNPSVTVIDGTTHATSTVAVGSNPRAIAVNQITNKIYVANSSGSVTVIDGATHATSTVAVGSNPRAIAVNQITNKIYVAISSGSVTVIDGATHATSTVAVGSNPRAIVVNPTNNKIYVANYSSATVTVIDGATNTASTVAVGVNPSALAVNPATNKIYVANSGSNNVTVIDGATNTASTVAVGVNPMAIAVNPTKNKIYVANYGSATVTIINGTTNTTRTVAVGINPRAIVVNPTTNNVYVANSGSATVTLIDEKSTNDIVLSADASDADGNISKVEFYVGTTLLGTSTTAPYRYNWDNVALGKYILAAKAYDNLNAVTTSAAVTINVTSGADLVMTAVNTAATSVKVGTSFTISSTEKNQNEVDMTANSNRVNFYLSPDTIITPADILIGSQSVSALAAGASSDALTTITMPVTVPAGAYYIGAIADATNMQGESIETNNALVGVAISVVHDVDLVMTAVSTTTTSVHVGSSFAITNTEKNQGTTDMTVSGNTIRFYLSTDATITPADIALTGIQGVDKLTAGTSSPVATTTVIVPVTVSPGTYYIGAIADAAGLQAETNETNNALAADATITVIRDVDLVMTEVGTTATRVDTGGSFTITHTEKNQGTTNATADNLILFYLSADAIITVADTLIGTRTVAASALTAGASSTATTTVSIPAIVASGTYYIGAIADATGLQIETNETNNWRAGGTITVIRDVDLVMTAVGTPATIVKVGTSFNIANTERNQGTTNITTRNTIRFYLSIDATITSADIAIGARTVAALAAGVSNYAATLVTVPVTMASGKYYIGAIADASGLQIETNETNNGRAGNIISVTR